MGDLKPSSERTRRRWECESVKHVSVPVDSAEWKYLLETLARELYLLKDQLQDVGPSGANGNNRSESLHHPGVTDVTPLTPASVPAGENGAWNAHDPKRAA